MNYIGMDIHKQFTFAVVKDEKGNELAKEKFENSRENFSKFLEIYYPEDTKIVMESTCVWEYIYEILEEMKYDVKLANPSRTKAIAYARIKTDAVDASTLADLLRANLVAESYIPPKEIRRLREITRERRTFVKQTTQIKNKIHAILIKRGMKFPSKTFCMSTMLWLKDKFGNNDIVYRYANLLEYHKEELAFIEGEIRKIADENKNAKLLMTIPGIAELRAVDIIAEIGEINRFQSGNKLCSYAGLVPSIKQSGNTLRFGKLVRQSSKILKNDLIESSWVIVRTKESNPLQEFYKRLAKKKGKQKAICATARKLCCVVYAILSKQKEFMVL
ncbi:MAG: IS110 family transposase [DPANN group archaeon]|nr:IS110 family transposase [DPANN group archaeon]